MEMKLNPKFLDEAKNIKWSAEFEGLKDRCKQGIILESVRLRNEFNGTDEEYQQYLEDFKKRYEKPT